MLLTRAPLSGPKPFSLDLHVLGAPLTFVLSQDQTLQFKSLLFGHRSVALAREARPFSFLGQPTLLWAGRRDPREILSRGHRIQFSRTEGISNRWLGPPEGGAETNRAPW